MSVIFEQDQDGIVTLTLDMPGRSMNVLNDALSAPFGDAISRIENDPGIQGVIVTSGKPEFLAGADLEKVYGIHDPAEAFQLAEDFKALLRRLERCQRPVVAALNGTALGGGLELVLACHHRIAINSPKAKFGLPEVKLGLLPGGGGTQRLPRLIGIQAALPLIMEGKELRPDAALKAGILQELVADHNELMMRAKAWCLANPKAHQPWDQKGFKWPGGDAKTPANTQLWSIAPAMTTAKTQGNYPAPIHILSSVFEGGLVDFDTGCRLESRYFAACVVSPVAKNLIHTLWFQLNAVNKGKSRPEGFARTSVQKLGILGAGMMGAGIAYSAAKTGLPVVLLDTTQEAAERGKAYSAKLLDQAISRGRETAEGKAQLLERIHTTTEYGDLAPCDLVIEAVFEDRTVKANVTRQAEAQLGADALFASNTSTLPITGLAHASQRPAQFIGLHFFSPVDKMPLVEIIVGQQTSQATLARAFDFVRQIKKTPIVVNDSRGFYTSRVWATYINEAMALLAEGQHPRAIEAAGLQAGMPVAPLALVDEVSLGLAFAVSEQTKRDLGDQYRPHPAHAVLETMVRRLDRIGKKTGKGFYDYPENHGNKTLWPGLTEHFPLAPQQLDGTELVERLLFAQAIEAAKCLEENVVTTSADTNIGSIFGWGFAPCHGGVLQYINAYGVARFVERAEQLAELYGERFRPGAQLKAMAQEGRTFE